jgi:hypothetical protein
VLPLVLVLVLVHVLVLVLVLVLSLPPVKRSKGQKVKTATLKP